MPQTQKGSCHCGFVQFEIDSDLADVTSCDCTICTRRGALIQRVDDADFRLLKPAASTLNDDTHGFIVYQFNTLIAKDYICPVCGIVPFRRPRTAPHLWAVNVRCLDDVIVDNLKIRKVFGSKLSVVENGSANQTSDTTLSEQALYEL